jgi:hypothetical protein
MDSFIRAYTNVIEKEHTEKIIKRFDEIADNSSFAGDAQFKSKARRHDDSIMLEDHSGQLVGVINKAIEGYLKVYLDEFPGGNEIDAIGFNVKLQRTYPGGGYHVWHSEQGNRSESFARVLVWLLYLNDISEGGETEFLNQRERVSPEAGKLVVWPAAWPWQHRGNPPLTETKYIATGWWYLALA